MDKNYNVLVDVQDKTRSYLPPSKGFMEIMLDDYGSVTHDDDR